MSEQNIVPKIKKEAKGVEEEILKRKKPTLSFPIRSLANVRYLEKEGYFEIRGKKKERTLTVNTVKTFAQTLKMMALSKTLVETDDIATKREAYYVSKNWGDARFLEQEESDTVMDDVEALFEVNREQMGFVPEEKGGDVAGTLVVIDKDTNTGTSDPDRLHASSGAAPTRSRSRSSISSSRRRPSSSSSSRPRACSSGW